MSIRASLVSFFLRRTLKKQMATFEDPEEVRQSPSLPGGKVPKTLSVEAVQAGGVPAEWVAPREHASDGVILYLHGGGYVFGGPDSHRDIACRLCVTTNRPVLLLDYRLAPEHRFPAAVDDATAAYQWLLESRDPSAVAVVGDSAGGGLSLALMGRLKSLNLGLPKERYWKLATASFSSGYSRQMLGMRPQACSTDPTRGVRPTILTIASSLTADTAKFCGPFTPLHPPVYSSHS